MQPEVWFRSALQNNVCFCWNVFLSVVVPLQKPNHAAAAVASTDYGLPLLSALAAVLSV